MALTFLFPEGRSRALTLSYDDGAIHDFRLLELFNRYGLKATFHLNSALLCNQTPPAPRDGTESRVNIQELADIYAGHEVACHGRTHPFLERLPAGEIMREVWNDKLALEQGATYPIIGMSYPYGTYRDQVLTALKAAGILYSRTTQSTRRFCLPDNYLLWHPTCHHQEALDLLPQFLRPSMNDYSVFYVWGHSHEFARNNNWQDMEEFAKQVAHRPEVWYATNRDIYYYDQAVRHLVMSADGTMIHNPSASRVWFKSDGILHSVGPGETFCLP